MDKSPTAEPNATPGQPRPHSPYGDSGSGTNRGAMIAAALLIALALGGGWWWWQQSSRVAPPPIAAPAPAAEPAPVAAAPAPSAAAPPAIANPIEAPVAAAPQEPLTLDKADPVIAKGLTDLLGAKAVGSMLRTDDFIRRAVATVDGMGRAHAAPRLWPVNPSAGKFSVQREGDGRDTIAAGNSARYAAFVGLVESIDVVRAAALYKTHYPLFQTAYKELGYPSGYFNDRLVQVLDQLLATPEPAAPPAVRLIEVKGEVASTQPWTRYEYVDAQYESMSAGQKTLLRMGPDNARRVKAKLRALRTSVAKAP
jgi:Protein of unknown function (DUF3014)